MGGDNGSGVDRSLLPKSEKDTSLRVVHAGDGALKWKFGSTLCRIMLKVGKFSCYFHFLSCSVCVWVRWCVPVVENFACGSLYLTLCLNQAVLLPCPNNCHG